MFSGGQCADEHSAPREDQGGALVDGEFRNRLAGEALQQVIDQPTQIFKGLAACEQEESD